MNEERIARLIKKNQIRKRSIDRERALSLKESAELNANIAKGIKLDENNSTLIFREIYESIMQLGDSLWWMEGCESLTHDGSMEILKDVEIKDKVKLNYLERFKKIRHDINYRGFKASLLQAKEILDFWNIIAKEIIAFLKLKLEDKK